MTQEWQPHLLPRENLEYDLAEAIKRGIKSGWVINHAWDEASLPSLANLTPAMKRLIAAIYEWPDINSNIQVFLMNNGIMAFSMSGADGKILRQLQIDKDDNILTDITGPSIDTKTQHLKLGIAMNLIDFVSGKASLINSQNLH